MKAPPSTSLEPEPDSEVPEFSSPYTPNLTPQAAESLALTWTFEAEPSTSRKCALKGENSRFAMTLPGPSILGMRRQHIKHCVYSFGIWSLVYGFRPQFRGRCADSLELSELHT